MIRIAIVEDEDSCREQLEDYIRRYEKEQNRVFQITLFEDGLDITEGYQSEWDIIFMDIKMKHMDGMTAAKEVRRYDTAVIIIFITTMAKFAIKGYEVDALDFVLKPVKYQQFSAKMQKALNMVKRISEQKYLFLPVEDRKERVSIENILYIEVKNHNLFIVTEHASYVIRSSMTEMEKELENYHFVRCNHSYLVNLKHVTGILKDMVQLGAYQLPISRPKKKQFLRELSDYLEAGYQS